MATLIGSGTRHDDFVSFARANLVIAARTAIRLYCFVRLHVPHVDRIGIVVDKSQRGSAAQTTSSATTSSAAATSTMSLRRFTCGRNGFMPMP